MGKWHCIAAGAIALAAFGPAQAADPLGVWLTQDKSAKVRIVACGEALCGSVHWLSQPNDVATGKPQTDKLNADSKLRSRPMLGVPVLINMVRRGEDNKWAGRIYNPDDGKTYAGSIELLDAGQLKVRACVTIFCQSETWARTNETRDAGR